MTVIDLQRRIKQATAFVSEGDTDRAIGAFGDIAAQYGNFEACYSILCDLYLKAGRTDFPDEWIIRAVKFDPTFNETFVDLASELQLHGKKPEALRVLSSLLKANADNRQAMRMLGAIRPAHQDVDVTVLDESDPTGTQADFPECLLRGEFLPLSLDLDVGNKCNASCIMCDGKERFMNIPPKWRTVDEVNNLFKDVRRAGWAILDGENCEPFLNKDLFDIIRIVKSKQAVVHVISNGSLIDEPAMEKMIDVKLDKLSVSVHGATRQTAEAIMPGVSFDEVISNIHQLMKLKERLSSQLPSVVIVFVGMKRNISELSELVTLAGRMGVGEIYIKSLLADHTEFLKSRLAGENLAAYPELLRREYERAQVVAEKYNVRVVANDPYNTIVANNSCRYFHECARPTGASVTRGKTRYCLLPFQKFHLRIDGTVNPCCSNTGRFVVMGDASENGLGSVWNSNVYIQLRRALLTGENLPPYCDECERAPMVDPVVMQMDMALRQRQVAKDECKEFVRENKRFYPEYLEGMKGIGYVPLKCTI